MARWNWIALAALAAAALAGPAVADTLKDQAKKAVTAGLEAQSAGRYDEAIEYYRKAYDAVPHPEILFNLAQVYRLKGELETALGLYQRYLAVEPKGRVAGDARRRVSELEKTIAQRKAEAAKADAAKTETARPDAARPDAVAKTDSAKPGAGKPETAGPDAVAKTDGAKPGPSKTETARPDPAAKTDGAKPGASKPETAAKTDGAKPGAGKPETARPDAVAKTDGAKPGAGKPETARPDPAAKPSIRAGAGRPDTAPPDGTTTRAATPATATSPPRTAGTSAAGGPDERTDDAAAASSRRRYAVITASAGGAAMITGAVFGVLARSKRDSAIAICGNDGMCDSTGDTSRANALLAASRARGTVSTVLFAVGGAGVVTGAILWFTGREAPTRTALAPVITPSSVGLSWGGRF